VASYSPQKIKKDRDRFSLELVKNPDILSELGRTKGPNQILVGFAAETEAIIENARRKLKRKKADILVLNEISTKNPAFGAEENEIHLLTRDGVVSLPPMKKSQAARRIWDLIVDFVEQRDSREMTE
jgi:phosphopantothenoylcysteine decarboxylase/phosphopantothenate--cysteine ligase